MSIAHAERTRRSVAGRSLQASLLALLSASAAACGKPNPPLLTPELNAKLAELPSPYARLQESGKERDVSAGATDIMVLQQGAPLRARVRREVEGWAGIYWPKAATWPSSSFGRYQHPKIDCPAAGADGEVCTLTFAPRLPIVAETPATASVALQIPPEDMRVLLMTDLNGQTPRGQTVTVRLDIDEGGAEPYLKPPPDRRPLLAPGAPRSRMVASDVELAHLGKMAVACRADMSPGPTWERRNCAIEYGPVRMTVGHDVYLPTAAAKDAAFADVADDLEMIANLQEASRLLVGVVQDPVLMRAFEPLRAGNNPGAMIMQLATNGAVQDDTGSLRAKVAANAPLIPWRDVIDQREFNVLCADAAAKHLPLLIYTADGAADVQSYIYDDQFKKFKGRAMLALVRLSPPAGDSPWAKAFAGGIGAGAWSSLTVTDKPRWTNNSCQVGKVLQGKAETTRPADVMFALVTGRAPPASAPGPQPE